MGTLGPGGFPSPAFPQVTKMLVEVVLVFAVLWMPYRTLVLLNSFVARPFLDPWVLLFCRTCVYTNSAINPVIYSLMSQKFQVAFRQLCRCGAEGPQRQAACLSTTSYDVVRETSQETQTRRREVTSPHPSHRSHFSARSEGCPAAAQPLPASLPPSPLPPSAYC